MNSAKMGADVATIPPKFLKTMYNHPLTDKGLADFLADWKKDRTVHIIIYFMNINN